MIQLLYVLIVAFLWLRTAKKGRCLTNLADKIVCANSLLEMPFEENSFDVVIGNPPYVR